MLKWCWRQIPSGFHFLTCWNAETTKKTILFGSHPRYHPQQIHFIKHISKIKHQSIYPVRRVNHGDNPSQSCLIMMMSRNGSTIGTTDPLWGETMYEVNASQNIVCEMSAIYVQGRWVNEVVLKGFESRLNLWWYLIRIFLHHTRIVRWLSVRKLNS